MSGSAGKLLPIVARPYLFENARGSVIIEAALTIPLLLLLAGGLIDYGMILRENAVVVSAARAGARAAAAATLSDSQSDPGEELGTSVFLCVLAKQSARKFLGESRLAAEDFIIEVLPAKIEVSLPSDAPPIGPIAGITVRVSHRLPRWYFFWRNAAQASAASTFATESGDLPAECGDPP